MGCNFANKLISSQVGAVLLAEATDCTGWVIVEISRISIDINGFDSYKQASKSRDGYKSLHVCKVGSETASIKRSKNNDDVLL